MLRTNRTTGLMTAGMVAAALIGAPALAQTVDGFSKTLPADSWLSSEIIGQYVYGGVGQDAERIGDVNNLVVTPEGAVDHAIIGVGGFLGVGEKNVAVDFSKLSFAVTGDGERRIVLAGGGKEQLEQAPEFTNSDGQAYVAPNIFGSNDSDVSDMKMTKAADLPTIHPKDLRASELINARVYTMKEDDWVGEVGDVVLGSDGAIDAVIIDFGGFLGIGEKEVAVGLDALTFKSDGDNDGDFYVYTNLTREQLEQAPTYDAEAYPAERENMRVGQGS